MPQQVSPELLQIYFFGVEPSCLEETVVCLEKLGIQQRQYCNDEVGLWASYSWLGRHSICVIRPIGRTSGLDTFLIEGGGIPGVQDVAEVIAYQWHHSEPRNPSVMQSFPALQQSLGEEHLLFLCFIKLSWDLLLQPNSWRGFTPGSIPGRATVVYGFSQALQDALAVPATQDLVGSNIKTLICGGIGDADIVLVGVTKERESLDALLYIVSQIGVDTIGAALYGWETASHLPTDCVVRDTITELGVPMEIYLKVLKEAQNGLELPRPLQSQIQNCMSGALGGDISLKRGHTGLANLHDQLAELAGHEWTDRVVLGEADIRLSPAKKELNLPEVLWLLAKLDARSAIDPRFPHRLGLELTVGKPIGKKLSSKRGDLLGGEGDPAPVVSDMRLVKQFNAPDIDSVIKHLDMARVRDMREDLRIVERMVERCMTLQKNPDLSIDTRRLAQQAFTRIVQSIKLIENLSDRCVQEARQADAQHQKQVALLDYRASLERSALLNAGMHLDRALSQHVRGSVNFLLYPVVQARGPDHFGSELLLSSGLAVAPRAAVQRIIGQLAVAAPRDVTHNSPSWFRQLREELEIIAEPIIYASHDTDFAWVPTLGMIRTPRWVLWYPTNSSFVLHEVGHALSEAGELAYVASSFLKALQDRDLEEHVYNRPLAKVSESEFIVVESGNQIEAQREALAPVAIALG